MKPLLALFVAFGISAQADVTVPNRPFKPDAIPDVRLLLQENDSLTVFEGMPNPFGERRVLDQELDRKKHFLIDVELFYEGLLSVSNEDKAALNQAFHSQFLFEPYHVHFCGGFHSDYAIEWKRNDVRVAAALICFGCGEAKILFGDEQRHVDLTKPGYELLKGILIKYRQNRPKYDPNANKPPVKKTPRMEVELPAMTYHSGLFVSDAKYLYIGLAKALAYDAFERSRKIPYDEWRKYATPR